jgi:MFS transporter, DHA1 family, tetracycline resistance protein
MHRALIPVLATVMLSAVGIGLTLPILPQLMRAVGHTDQLAWRFGAFTGLYALMQSLCAPLLGSLSDRYGRRPVLLASLAGAVIDYLFMAMAPTLWMLFVGRAIAGVTGASIAVTSAFIADVTPEAQRARRYGQLGASFGVGFIIGPLIGGWLGNSGVRAPFLAAAAMNGLNLLLVLLAMPATRPSGAQAGPSASLNPLSNLRWAGSFSSLLSLIGAYGVLTLVGEIGGIVWVLYGEDKFVWNTLTIGLSLACFGVFHAVTQAVVAGPIAERWGGRRALLIGIVADSCASVLIALTTQGWIVFLLMPLFCLGGIGGPALLSMASGQVGRISRASCRGCWPAWPAWRPRWGRSPSAPSTSCRAPASLGWCGCWGRPCICCACLRCWGVRRRLLPAPPRWSRRGAALHASFY